ncbi:hypothetical protein [Acidovorax lacteus]|uniref:Adhesin n=1 Tax=Acidovorax lacteus TaxID=1924988 RepID=A0ABP8LB85_9BURK
MKKTAIAAVIALSATAASASGPYDGIYVDATNSNNYVSVLTNGDRIVVTQYEIIPASNIFFSTQIGTVYPRQVNTWQLLQGNISGNIANLSGQLAFNQCNVRITVNFTGTSFTANTTSASSSGAAYSSTINCAGLFNLNPLRFNKIF